jgi:hypothetical protein
LNQFSIYLTGSSVMKRFVLRIRGDQRGQSFVELMLITLILALLLAGMVEFGFLMNNYLHVLDGAREGARYSSSSTAFIFDKYGVITDQYDPEFYYITAWKAAQTMSPVQLDPANDDDILVSVFSVTGSSAVRFPLWAPNGWSLCAHYADFTNYLASKDISVPDAVGGPGWGSCTAGASHFSVSDIADRLTPGAPATGVLLVEILYKYPQLLKLPVLTSVIPDPIPLYVYSMMPNAAAEPTPTPP